jgi:uncharacterized protein YjbI with pentapeptide repeats
VNCEAVREEKILEAAPVLLPKAEVLLEAVHLVTADAETATRQAEGQAGLAKVDIDRADIKEAVLAPVDLKAVVLALADLKAVAGVQAHQLVVVGRSFNNRSVRLWLLPAFCASVLF